MSLTYIYIYTVHPKAKTTHSSRENILWDSSHSSKTSHNKVKNTEIISSMLSNHMVWNKYRLLKNKNENF